MERLLQSPKITLFAIVFLSSHLLVFSNVWHLSWDLIYGDNSAQELIPSPRYEVWRIPDSDFTRSFQGQNRLAADFAQIYFPAQDESVSAYTDETLDPWGRPSRYAPILHELCRFTICNLPYGPASAVHLLVQSILFFASFLYAFLILDIRKYALLGILAVNVCLFLTPVGLSVFERGQLSLYVASSYLWLFLGLIRHHYSYIALSALFAFAKLTSFPFIFVVMCLWLLDSRDRTEWIERLKLAVTFPLVICLLFAIYLHDGIEFLLGLVSQEVTARPEGFSLGRILPPYILKALPFILVAVGYALLRWRHEPRFVALLPYLTGVCILLLMYPTLAFDYGVPTLFGFIPLLYWWRQRLSESSDPIIRHLPATFLIFITASSYSTVAGGYPSPIIYSYIMYISFSTAFMLVPMILPRRSFGSDARP